MSEPTGDGKQQPDPQDEQDQNQGSVFSDPTAPVWADPTAPIPAAPAPEPPAPAPPAPGPPGPASPYGQQPPAPTATPPAPPVSNPYAQQPPPAPPYGQQPPAAPWVPSQPDPYGQPQPGQPYPAYGQQPPAYGQPYPAYGQQPYGTDTSASNTSAIVLTIVSALTTVTTCVIGIPSLIFGIMALTSNSTDPVGSRKKSRTGWIIFALNAGLILLTIIAIIAIVIANDTGGSLNLNSGL